MKAWWENLSQRERVMIASGGAVLAVIFLYLLIYSPLLGGIHKLQKQVAYQRNELAKVQQINADIQHLSVSSIAPTFNADNLRDSLQQTDLSSAAKKIQQPQPNQFLLDFTYADFDTLINWLTQLSTQYDVHPAQLNLVGVTGEPGLVNGSILLQIPKQ